MNRLGISTYWTIDNRRIYRIFIGDGVRCTVLIVDDDKHVINSMKRALYKEPYKVLSADSAEKALTMLDGAEVDLVISDELTPGTKGAESLSYISAYNQNHACRQDAASA